MSFRIGQGYDVHQLQTGLPLIIGGVDIPHAKGVLAHSDGDVLIHAIIDAMLGAVNLGDIGQLFPNSKEWKNESGLKMLQYAYHVIKNKFPKLKICNIDATLILEAPKVSSHITQMQNNLVKAISDDNFDISNISIKATTTDQLGFIGLETGIAAQAICLIQLK